MTILDPPTLIALGANLPGPHGGNPRATCQAAIAAMEALPGLRFVAVSRWYRTEPIPRAPDQPDFCNGVACFESNLDPESLLAALLDIEQRIGRTRGAPNAARVIDLDVIAVGALIRDSIPPVLPHPRAHERRFVLDPLCDIAPDWVHPRLGRSAMSLRDALIATGTQRIELWTD